MLFYCFQIRREAVLNPRPSTVSQTIVKRASRLLLWLPYSLFSNYNREQFFLHKYFHIL